MKNRLTPYIILRSGRKVTPKQLQAEQIDFFTNFNIDLLNKIKAIKQSKNN